MICRGRLIILIFLMIYFVYPIALGATVKSEFSCSNREATTTFYSYLKEPSLQESGYTRGLKAGTFNYFKNGNVDLSHTTVYYDGRIDADHPPGSDTNSTLRSNLNVNFIGESGISEYYAKGFYPNNRAISAFKKIWSIDYSNKDWMLGGIYKSQSINVEASAKLGPNMTGGDFSFLYHANVGNGYLELKDATGWTNKTGSRRIDWEQEAAMKGAVLDVTNNLEVNSLYYASAGLNTDWLPCCSNGTVPAIEGLDTPWPSPGVKATLLPNMKRPGCTCTPYRCDGCKNDQSSKGTSATPTASKIVKSTASTSVTPTASTSVKSTGSTCDESCCSEDGCPSFPCIYTYPDESGSSASGLSDAELNLLRIGERIMVVGEFGKPGLKNVTSYAMMVKNTGDVPIGMVNFDVKVPEGFNITSTHPSMTGTLEDGTPYWRIGPLAPLDSWDLALEITPPETLEKWGEEDQKAILSTVSLKAFGTYNNGNPFSVEGNLTPNADWVTVGTFDFNEE
jgi:hypothetical protein